MNMIATLLSENLLEEVMWADETVGKYCYETSELEMFQIHSLSNLMQMYAITLTLPCAIQ